MKAVTFTLDGDPQVYSLKFDFNAVCDAEPIANCNLMEPIAGARVTAMQTRGLLFACLKTAHPLVTLSEAGELLSRDMPTVLAALSTIMKDSRNDDEDAPPEPEPQSMAAEI